MGNDYKVIMIPMAEIFSDDEFNCRGKIAPLEVIDLARDIRENGLDIPITVQPYTKHPPHKYRIIAGHRRHMAFRINEQTSIPCNIREDFDELGAAGFNLRENLTRAQLNMKQEAKGLKRFKLAGWNENDVAKFLHQSRGWVQVRYMLLTLPEDIQDEAAAGMITQDHIRKLYGMNQEDQYHLVRKIKEAKFKGDKVDLPVEKKKDANTKTRKAQDRFEIFQLIDYLLVQIGSNLTTRALAWAAGEISYTEFFKDVEEYCEENGLTYRKPDFLKAMESNGESSGAAA